jgi:hypothetical protein
MDDTEAHKIISALANGRDPMTGEKVQGSVLQHGDVIRTLHVAGWISRRQLAAIDYLKEENRLLKERLGGRRLRLTDAQRRRLARRA